MKQKLYAYVDESGQDTGGRLFLVAVIVVANEHDVLKDKLAAIERRSRKGARKWYHTNRERREQYIHEVIESRIFKENIFYSNYPESKAYFDLTIFTTAKAILGKAQEPYETTVIVDGLKRSERQRFAAGLRRLQVRVRKVRGVRENAENEVFIRLADAIAGFVRDYMEGDVIMTRLYEHAEKQGMLERV